MLVSASSTKAQTKVWDFGANPMGAGFTDMITVANQTTCALFPAGSLTGGVDASHQVNTVAASAVFGELTINTAAGDRWRSDNASLVLYDSQLNNNGITPVFTGASKSGRLAFNGTGNATRRYYTIALAAGQTVTYYFKVNVTGTANFTTTVPAGSAVSTTQAYAAVTNVYDMRTLKITADVAGNYTIGDYTNKTEMYRIYLGDVNAGINLATGDFEKDLSLDIFSIKNQIYVTNVLSNTDVKVFSIAGALIKSVKITENTSFELNSGLYIVRVKSAEGEKSVKVLVN
ncbi:MAG: T9SS type A sorting domain-containing protein [Flavobacterium sp.]